MTKGKLYGSQDSDHAIVHLGLNVSSSAHNCGCVVDGGNAMAAIWVLLLFNIILEIIIIYTNYTLEIDYYYKCTYNNNWYGNTIVN